MIDVQNVSKIYGRKQTTFAALSDVSVSLDRGTSVAIIGKSGSGKSTLMHVMSGLDSVSEGTVSIDGQVLGDMKPREKDSFRAKKMGFIFQSFFVQGTETCFNNVAMPLEIANVPAAKRKKLVMKALESVELADKVDQKAKNLSGGQKQRLAIARAIVNTPQVLFADEPTGNLDSTTGDAIEALLFDLNKRLGCTLVIVTHDEELAAKCDRQIYIKDGHIAAASTRKAKK